MKEDQLLHHLDSAGLTLQAESLAQSHAAVRKKLHQKSSRLQKVGDLVPVASLQHYKVLSFLIVLSYDGSTGQIRKNTNSASLPMPPAHPVHLFGISSSSHVEFTRDVARVEGETESTKKDPAKVAKERETIARHTIQHEMQDLLSSTAEVFGFIQHDADREQYVRFATLFAEQLDDALMYI